MRRQLFVLCPWLDLNQFSGKLREGILAAKRRDGFASDGLSLSLLVLCPLSQPHSLRDVPANLRPFFLRHQYRINPLIPAPDLLYLSTLDVFKGFDGFNHPPVAVGFFLSLPTRLLRTPSGVHRLRVYCTRFPNHFLVSFSRGGDSIMQLLQG